MPTPPSTRVDWNSFFAARAASLLAELGRIVRLESPSREPDHIRAVAEHFAHAFSEAGARASLVEDHPNGPNLLVHYGEGDRPTMLLGHLDTVWPLGSLEGEIPWRVEGGLAFGPGVFDMKSGCLMGLEAVRA